MPRSGRVLPWTFAPGPASLAPGPGYRCSDDFLGAVTMARAGVGLVQAYDFLELYRRYGCLLQMGGSDQWGNIINGIDLTRRVLDTQVFGLTSPLLTTSDGRKMGKSAGGAVWLNGAMLSPYEFWQFWRNTTDADVGRFLKLYTELPVEDCDRLGALGGAAAK